jgi:hypothetical protein
MDLSLNNSRLIFYSKYFPFSPNPSKKESKIGRWIPQFFVKKKEAIIFKTASFFVFLPEDRM